MQKTNSNLRGTRQLSLRVTPAEEKRIFKLMADENINAKSAFLYKVMMDYVKAEEAKNK